MNAPKEYIIQRTSVLDIVLSSSFVLFVLHTFSVPIPVLIALLLGNTGKYETFYVAWLSTYYNVTRCVSHEVCDSGYTVICIVIWRMKYRALIYFNVSRFQWKATALDIL
jgi:hypothetical protein